jgi:hypothetical protein
VLFLQQNVFDLKKKVSSCPYVWYTLVPVNIIESDFHTIIVFQISTDIA